MDLDTALTGKAPGGGATDRLREDHALVRRLFRDFAQASDDPHAARVIAEQICMQCDLHDRVEREVFYPKVRGIDDFMLARAFADHRDLPDLMHAVESAGSSPACRDAIAHLESWFAAHVAFEEEELFPLVDAKLAGTLAQIGDAIGVFKEAVTGSTDDKQSAT